MQPVDRGRVPRRHAPAPVLPATAPACDGHIADDGSAPVVRPRGRPRALLALARPRQWLKNALVIAAPGAAGALGHDDVPGRVLVACIGFCLISAGIYALNDVRDRHEDRRHPRKRLRPVAAGEIAPPDAVLFGCVVIVCGLVMCTAVTPLLTLVGFGYLALTVSYSWVWRHVRVLDLIALAGGFVLRALAGGVAAPVGLSRWFVLVVTCAALFVATGKRLAELLRSVTTGTRGRRVLRRYSARGLRRVLAVSQGGALFAYCVWAFELPDIDGVPWRLLTVIPFTVCLLRYGRIMRAGAGEAPEEVVVSDSVMATAGLAWLVLFGLSVNAAG
jgi:decaprenyl-phosphate phosphoribosyltransferase